MHKGSPLEIAGCCVWLIGNVVVVIDGNIGVETPLLSLALALLLPDDIRGRDGGLVALVGVCMFEGYSLLTSVLFTIVLLVSLLSVDVVVVDVDVEVDVVPVEEVPFVLAAIRAEVRIPVEGLPLDKLEVRLTIVLCGLMLSKVPFMNSSILLKNG